MMTIDSVRQRGFSLVELMIALLLGTLVIAAAGGIFLTNRQTFRSTDDLGRVQEGLRTSFELMARDIREAAGNPCSNAVPLANVISSPASRWWTSLQNWGEGIRGYGATEAFGDAGFGTGSAQRLSGTQAIELFATETPVRMVTVHNAAGSTFTLVSGDHGFAAGDIAMVCSPHQAALFQISSVTGNVVGHGTGGTPGNCTANLGVPVTCGAGMSYQFSVPNTVLARMHAARWFVANNPAGRRSRYQQRLSGGAVTSQEVVEGVRNLQFTYLMRGGGSYVDADTVTTADAWAQVVAVRIVAEVEGEMAAANAPNAVVRSIEHVVSLRNRNS